MPLCPGSALFSISIKLTEGGIKHYREVIKTVFQYISMMRDGPPQEWIVNELKRMSEINFRFKQNISASSTTSSLAEIMQQKYPRERLLSGASLIREFNPEAISKAMSYLRPDNFRLTVVSKDFPREWDRKETWYGTEYRCERILQDFLAEIERAARSSASERPAELHLPYENKFIPNRLEVEKKETKEALKIPKLIRSDENVRTWFKKDDQFWVPKASVDIMLRSPLTGLTPHNTAVAILYCELVQDVLVEYSYDAKISGLDYSIIAHSLGVDVSLSGYNDRIAMLLEKVLVSMRELVVRENRFQIVKGMLIRNFCNWDFQQPYHQAEAYSNWLSNEKGWTNEQLRSELPNVTAAGIH